MNFHNLFWKQQNISFQKSYFQDWLVLEGLPEPEDMGILMEPLFSPQTHFIYPLDWSWMEQDTDIHIEEKVKEDEEDKEIIYQKREVDWERVIGLWEPIFVELLEKGEYHLSRLRDIPLGLQEKWLEQKEAIDLWLLFHSEPLDVPSIEIEKDYSDERLVLLTHLVRKQVRFHRLEGKMITSFIDANQQMIHWNGASISPFVLRITD